MRIVAKSMIWVLFWAWSQAIVTCYSRSFGSLSVIGRQDRRPPITANLSHSWEWLLRMVTTGSYPLRAFTGGHIYITRYIKLSRYLLLTCSLHQWVIYRYWRSPEEAYRLLTWRILHKGWWEGSSKQHGGLTNLAKKNVVFGTQLHFSVQMSFIKCIPLS